MLYRLHRFEKNPAFMPLRDPVLLQSGSVFLLLIQKGKAECCKGAAFPPLTGCVK